MSQPHSDHNEDEQDYGRGGTATKERPASSERSSYQSESRAAVDEARRLLDEIAGVAPEKRRKPKGRDAAQLVKNLLLSPFLLIIALVKLIIAPFRRADFKLAQEMKKFLAHPGHFFWFNRLAPEAAKAHFGTNNTDDMTHHARRYGAHSAMLILAVVVVVGGGFTGLTKLILSPDAYRGPSGQVESGYIVKTGLDGKDAYLNALGTSEGGTRRMRQYTTQKGDTWTKLATQNNISLDTITFANNIIDGDSSIPEGKIVVIPPITGMFHVSANGINNSPDTVGKIAAMYRVDPKVILEYGPNQLGEYGVSKPLPQGLEIMVPNGQRPPRAAIYIYNTKPGDTIVKIAAKFGITPDTVSIKNDMYNDPNEQLDPGLEVQILPMSGIQVFVQPTDTVEKIAQRYSVIPSAITNFEANNVAINSVLQPGTALYVPGGKVPAAEVPPRRPAPTQDQTTVIGSTGSRIGTPKPPPPKPVVIGNSGSTNTGRISAPPAGASVKSTGSMIWPMRGLITTYFGQTIWYGIHHGIDISTSYGTPIVAADGGTVVSAGWNGGYGNCVIISHGNGIFTLYGHMASINVYAGQGVARGQLVGLEGSTGNSTGPHLHFEVRIGNSYDSVVDPLRFLP